MTAAKLDKDEELDAVLGVQAVEVVAAYQLNGRAGQIACVVAKTAGTAVRIAFLGVGDRGAGALRRAASELGRMLRPGETVVSAAGFGKPPVQVRAFAMGILLGPYRYTERSASPPEAGKNTEVRLLLADEESGAAVAVAAAVGLARDLTNTPSARKSPQWLADSAASVAASAGLGVRLWTDQELAAAGFGGITAVGAGSGRPPTLIELSYEPPGAERHVVWWARASRSIAAACH